MRIATPDDLGKWWTTLAIPTATAAGAYTLNASCVATKRMSLPHPGHHRGRCPLKTLGALRYAACGRWDSQR